MIWIPTDVRWFRNTRFRKTSNQVIQSRSKSRKNRWHWATTPDKTVIQTKTSLWFSREMIGMFFVVHSADHIVYSTHSRMMVKRGSVWCKGVSILLRFFNKSKNMVFSYSLYMGHWWRSSRSIWLVSDGTNKKISIDLPLLISCKKNDRIVGVYVGNTLFGTTGNITGFSSCKCDRLVGIRLFETIICVMIL